MTVTERSSIRQVAERAGVSRMTVSRVLSDRSHLVAEDTRRRVLKAVRELEYVPVAQPMTQSRRSATRVIGLVFDGTPFEGAWGLPTFLGFREAAQQLDYDLLILTRTRPEWMTEREETQFLDRRSDGLIFIAPIGHYQILETLVKRGLPVVTCYTNDAPAEVPIIVIDNEEAMRQAVQHLHEKGHERLLHLTSLSHRSDFQERRRGYEHAMQERRLNPFVLDISGLSQADAAALFLKTIRDHRTTGVVAHNDMSASFAWNVAEENGINVPRDLSITGMDDLAAPAERGLTSVHFSCEEVGKRALETVVALIHGNANDARGSMVPVKLVERSSVAPPAA